MKIRGVRANQRYESIFNGPTVVMTISAEDAYDLADFYEGLRDGIADEAPYLRSAADEALGRSGRRM